MTGSKMQQFLYQYFKSSNTSNYQYSMLVVVDAKKNSCWPNITIFLTVIIFRKLSYQETERSVG